MYLLEHDLVLQTDALPLPITKPTMPVPKNYRQLHYYY